MNELERIRRDLDIESFDELTPGQMRAILESVGKDRYTVEALREIAPMVPHFAGMANEAVKSIYELAREARRTHDRTLEALESNIRLLERIVSHPGADKEILLKVADKAAEITKAIQEMNRTWSDVFRDYGSIALKIGTVAVVGITAVALGGRPGRA